mmetsp:Transcript_19794/g.55004  ORF Transcript_19794/g.55004 Transcript_19794/m.55004 type:complete len:230 (-) Transcript_19794:685-1374(-)
MRSWPWPRCPRTPTSWASTGPGSRRGTSTSRWTSAPAAAWQPSCRAPASRMTCWRTASFGRSCWTSPAASTSCTATVSLISTSSPKTSTRIPRGVSVWAILAWRFCGTSGRPRRATGSTWPQRRCSTTAPPRPLPTSSALVSPCTSAPPSRSCRVRGQAGTQRMCSSPQGPRSFRRLSAGCSPRTRSSGPRRRRSRSFARITGTRLTQFLSRGPPLSGHRCGNAGAPDR